MNRKGRFLGVAGFIVIAALIAGGAAGCGGAADAGGGGSGGGGTIGSSSGRLTAPNGDPISGAAVVVSSSATAGGLRLKNAAGHPIHGLKTMTDDEGENCEDVDVEGTVLGQDCTDADGNYSLAYDVEVECGDTVTFSAKKESFNIEIDITVTCDSEDDGQDLGFDEFELDDDCGVDSEVASVIVSDGRKFSVSYECKSGAAGIPNMAVCDGEYDSLQDVLAKLGYAGLYADGRWDGVDADADFDFFQSMDEDSARNPDGNTRPSCCDLLQGETITTANGEEKTIDDYDIVFVNCGNGCDGPDGSGGFTHFGGLEDIVPDLVAQSTIQGWVNSGGRLYVTDLSYDFVEQNFPSIVDFAEDVSDPAVAETSQAAQTGADGITVDADVAPDLAAYLAALPNLSDGTSILNADGTVTIEGFLGAWAPMVGLHDDAAGGNGGTVWVEGTVSGGVSDPQPLTITSSVGEGEVLYTSYHTVDESSVDAGLDPDELRPQEDILAFLIFEL